jgi:serine/threonine protein kinase
MKQQEVADYYATITSPLLTAIRDAARAIVPGHEGQGVHLHETGQDQEGRVLAFGDLVMTREGPNDSVWTLAIGFDNAQNFYDSINLDVPRGQFPPMHVPIELSWLGVDDWARRQTRDVSVPPLELSRDSISWLERRWSKVSEVDAEWIVRTLLERWVLHDTPAAAEEARQQVPGARWERVAQLSGWGQNEVWRVRDVQSPAAPHRAMKMLRWRKGPGTTAYKRLLREIEITRKLAETNPGIIQVIDYGIPREGDEWTPFYVMPLADTTLTKATDFGGNLEAVLNLGITVANALGAAHAAGVIHRDVKPGNVLLFGPERRPVLADFGICFLETEEGQRLTGSEANTVGPANYVAPELLGGKADSEAIDPRVDVYSLGKTLYFALSGGDDLPREYHTQDRYDLRRKFDDPRMAHFYGLLERIVVEDPARRFPTMQAWAEAFTRALANIKKSVPYSPGMYGGVVTPVERSEQLARLLATANGLPRQDGIREAITDARKGVESLVAGLGLPGGRPAATDMLARVAAEAAENLMAAGLPLVAAGDSQGFERWLDEIVAPLLPDGTGGMSEASNTRRAASVVAFYGVAVVSWHMERLAFLAAMLKKYDEHAHAFIHLRIFGGEVEPSWKWIGEALRGSAVLRRVRPELEIEPELVNVAGLGALVSLLSTKPEALATAVPDRGDLNIILFPAFMPQASDWVEALPARFIRTPVFERAAAQELFGTTPEDLRENCKRITTKLRRILAWTASQLSRTTSWIGGIPHGGAWSRWTGADVPSPIARR